MDILVKDALKQLRVIVPGSFATVTQHLHGEMNRPENILHTVDSAEIYIEGGYWFRGPTLTKCMEDVKKWAEVHIDDDALVADDYEDED